MKRATVPATVRKKVTDFPLATRYSSMNMEFQDLTEIFLNHCESKGLSSETVKAYGFHLRRFSDWLSVNGIPASDITHLVMDKFEADIQKRISETTGKSLSRTGINSTRRTLFTFWKYISSKPELWGRQPNPYERLNLLPETDRREEKMLDVNDITALLKACNKYYYTGYRNFIAILFLWDTGCRLGELLRLKRSDIDLNVKIKDASGREKKIGLVRVIRSKSGRKDSIVISGQLRGEMLTFAKKVYDGSGKMDWTVKSDYFFCSMDGNQITKRNFAHILDRIAVRAKLGRHIHPHLFRKSSACERVKGGKNSKRAIEEQFGWKSDAMLRYYTKTLTTESFIQELVEGCPGDSIKL